MASSRRRKLLEPGAAAPEFRLARFGGGDTSLRDILAAGPALLAFFKVTCPICQLTFPFLERLHAAGAIPIYGISQNDPRDTRDFILDFGITFPTLFDTEESGYPVSNEYGISSVPTLVLVEPDGTVSHVIEGWQKKQMEWLGTKAGAAVFRPDDHVPEWKSG